MELSYPVISLGIDGILEKTLKLLMGWSACFIDVISNNISDIW